MFTKLRTLRTIDESGAVLIVRLPDADTAERVAHAAIEGGFRALEITLSIPGAVDLIRRLAAQYDVGGRRGGGGDRPRRPRRLRVHPRRRGVPGQPAAQPRDDPRREPLPGADDQRGVHPDRDPRVGRGGCGHRQAVPDRERGHPLRQGRARAPGAPADHARGRRDTSTTSRSGSRRAWSASAWAAPSPRRGSPTATSPGSPPPPATSSPRCGTRADDRTDPAHRHRHGGLRQVDDRPAPGPPARAPPTSTRMR